MWTDEDQKWAEQMINRQLAEWIWTTLPARDQLQNMFQRARTGPFRLHRWRQVVREGVQYEPRTAKGGFKKVLQELLPENWTVRNKGKQWQGLQELVLDPISDRISGRDPSQHTWYSGRVRQAATALLMEWEFLPSAQKKQIWSYQGAGLARRFNIHKNPRFIGS